MKCKVLPPRGIYIPVCLRKCNGTLLFSLCRTCGESYQSECTHTVSERAFVGTWVTDELKMAITKGYELLECYEVWTLITFLNMIQVQKLAGYLQIMLNTFLKVKTRGKWVA